MVFKENACDSKPAEGLIAKERSSCVTKRSGGINRNNHITGQKRGQKENYDLCVNGEIGVEKAVDLICNFLNK